MARQYIDLGEQAFIFINGPFIFFNLTANVFYAFCLIFLPRNRQRLKHPLKLLLGFLVWCSTIYCVSLVSLCCVLQVSKSFEMFIVVWAIVLYYVHNSMTSYVWLTFYYYIQIVPAQRALFIWVKKNIKFVIYMVLLLDGMIFLFNDAVAVANIIHLNGLIDINGTLTEHRSDELYLMKEAGFFIIKVHILICLCIMTVCSLSTVRYLHRHMRSVSQSGSSFSTLQSQMRITITGISQGVLYFLYGTFHLFDSFMYLYSTDFYLGTWVSLTVTSLYISGTTVNLGIGQAAFRQRAADVWKALKALCGVGIVTNDVTLYTVDIN